MLSPPFIPACAPIKRSDYLLFSFLYKIRRLKGSAIDDNGCIFSYINLSEEEEKDRSTYLSHCTERILLGNIKNQTSSHS